MALNVGELYASLSLDSKPFDKGVEGIQGKLGKLGGAVTGAFAGVMAGAVGALGGAMVGGIATVNNYQQAVNGLQAQTGATAAEMDEMGGIMKDIYAANYGESFQDIGDTLAYAKQVTGETGEELRYLAQDALMLRDTFGYDVNESIKASDQLMNEFGLTGDAAMAMIAEATQKGLNRSDDLIDTIDEYSVYFAQAGMDAEDMFGVMENASKAGVRNLDFVGDAMKEFGIIMKEDSERATEALTALGLPAEKLQADFAAGGEKAKEAFQTITAELGSVEDPLTRNQLGVELFGTKFEDLEADAVVAMGNVEGSITGAAETLQEIDNIKYDSFTEAMAGIGRQIQVGLIMPIGEQLLPHLETFSNWIASKMPVIQGYFDQFSAKVGEVFGAIGPKVEGAKSTFETFSTGVSNIFSRIWETVGPIMDMVGQKVMDVVSSVVSWWQTNGAELLANFQIVFNGIMSVVDFVMPAVLMVVEMVFNSVKGVITGALDVISGAFKIFAGIFTGDWSKMWDGVKQLVSGAIKFIWNLWNLMLVGRLVSGIKTLATKIVSGFKNMWTKAQNLFNSFVTGVQNKAASFVSNIVSRIKNLLTNFKNTFNTLRTFGASIWNSLTQAVMAIVRRWVSNVKSSVNGMKTRVTQIFTNISTTAGKKFNSIKEKIMGPIKTAKDKVLGWIDDIKSGFSNFATNIALPHFSVSNFSLNPKDWITNGIPKLSVDWYKTGGIATGPAIAGIGEAGSEAIVPLSGQRMKPFADEIAKQMSGTGGGVTINMYGDNHYSDDLDIDYVAEKLGNEVNKKTRVKGGR